MNDSVQYCITISYNNSTFDSPVVGARHDVLSRGIEVHAPHHALVPLELQHLLRRERLQVARGRQLGHQVLWADGELRGRVGEFRYTWIPDSLKICVHYDMHLMKDVQ